MRVLITGATGFLGTHLVHRMISDGHEVRCLVRASADPKRVQKLAGIAVAGDVTDIKSLRTAVANADCVIHAAADMNYWRLDPARQMLVNAEGARNVAIACREGGVRMLLHVSSAGAVGIPPSPEQPANEESRFNLADSGLDYHISKRRGEEAVLDEALRGLNAVIVNPTSVTGPERIAGLFGSVRRSPVVPCFSGGNCAVHVSDVVEGIVLAIARGRPGERYILGGENLTFVSMARKAAKMLRLSRSFVKLPPLFTAAAAAVFEPFARRRRQAPKFAWMIHYCANRHLYYDSSKAQRELGYRPRDFDSILRSGVTG